MGLLGTSECDFLTKRIFIMIARHKEKFQFNEFLTFLNTITHGSIFEKAEVSFNFLDRNKNNVLQYSDIQMVINELCLIWNFLTGEKIHPGAALQIICSKLGITESKGLTFDEYIMRYDQSFSWFDYFNNYIVQKEKKTQNMQFRIDQIQQYLKFVHTEVASMILELKEPNGSFQSLGDQETNLTTDLSIIKGPIHVLSQPFKPNGDVKNRDSLIIHNSEQLSDRLEDRGFSKFQILINRLEQMKKVAKDVLPQYCEQERFEVQSKQDRPFQKALRNTILGLTKTSADRKNLVYLGHESWNLMLNLMIGMRKALKSHLYLHRDNSNFNAEDLGSKYAHDLIYKKKSQSIKQLCEIFVDYAPKVFSFVRSTFKIQNTQILRSIGFQNLLGNLLLGNMSTLTDQIQSNYGNNKTNFIYYTSDLRLIVKSISGQESTALRSLLYSYARYCQNNPNTFLPKIYGLYKLKNKSTNRQIYFIVMNNVFCVPVTVDLKYQLKGDANQYSAGRTQGYLTDVHLIKQPKTFQLQIEQKKRIFNQIRSDVKFLEQHNITRYRLHAGVSRGDAKTNTISRGSFLSRDAKELYFFGLFNILEEYSTTKLIEVRFKTLFTQGSEFLTPKQYRERFLNFIAKYIFAY